MKIGAAVFATVSALLTGNASAQEIALFGVQLGGKLPYQVRSCHESGKVEKICWVGKPFVWKGGKLGATNFPDEKLPKWAEHSMLELSLSKDNVIEHISIKDLPLSSESEIVTSLERRFGTPRTLSKAYNGSITGWKKDNIEIEMICPKESACSIRFLSAKQAAELTAEKEKRERKDLARPLSP